MTDDELAWIVEAALIFDCLVFVLRPGYRGIMQALLLPRSTYGWTTALHPS